MKDKSIIVSVSWGIGDFIWATSAISLIKNYNKNIKIALLTRSEYGPLIKSTNLVDDYMFYNQKLLMSDIGFIRYLYKIYFILKNFFKVKKYSSIVFLDNHPFFVKIMKNFYNIKNIYGTNLAGYGYNLPNEDIKYLTHIIEMPKDMDKLHCIMKYQMIVRKIFPTYNLSIPNLPNTSYLRDNLKQKFLQNVKKYKIALCTKGSTSYKYWATEYFVNLIKIINEKYDVSFFILGNEKKQKETAHKIKNSLMNIDIRNICGQTSLLEFKEMISCMDLLISVDSSAIHFAALYNIPTIALYGQSLPSRTGAVNPKAISLCNYEDCSPCEPNYKKIVCKYPKCMYNITPDIVFEKTKEILK